jgi:hypothetical protein
MIDYRDPSTLWFGIDPCFWYPLERDARRHLKEPLSVALGLDQLTYFVQGLRVPGDREPHNVRIEFHRVPPYDTYGLAPQDYPRVFTNVRRHRKHAFPGDGALCLWFPHDPIERRWVHALGLEVLIEMTRRQLLLELEFSITGRWPMEDAPHDFPESKEGRSA